MLPQPGAPEFGDTRQIDRKTYELYETFGSRYKAELNRAEAVEVRDEIKGDYESVRMKKNDYGSYALYVFGKKEKPAPSEAPAAPHFTDGQLIENFICDNFSDSLRGDTACKTASGAFLTYEADNGTWWFRLIAEGGVNLCSMKFEPKIPAGVVISAAQSLIDNA